MIRGRKGIKNPRDKAKEFLTQKGWFFEGRFDGADSYIGEGLKIIVDFDEHSISWLVPTSPSHYYIGRSLKYDPMLSGDELADMIMEGAKEVGKSIREKIRERG